MSKSSITKKLLSNSFKELMKEKKFSKISVADICELCEVNRKTFYYHFKDKYELLNWIFDNEFMVKHNIETEDSKDLFSSLCSYLYANKDFYREALKIDDYNSFRNYLEKSIFSIVSSAIKKSTTPVNLEDFHNFIITDGVVCAIERWISNCDCEPANVFVDKFNNFVEIFIDREKIKKI